MRDISLLIKPVSGACNLRCSYCFYRDIVEKRGDRGQPMMSLDLLEQLVRQSIGAASSRVQLAFQGGEPMLAGLDFYKKAVEFAERYKSPEVQVEKSIQTNGTMISREWARFFRDNDFLVGVSLDGTEDIHDAHRRDGENGSFQQIVRAVKLLQEENVDFNVLSVVTEKMCGRAEEVYTGLKGLGVQYIQFIPCIAPAVGEGWAGCSLTAGHYAEFLKELFDLWYTDYLEGEYVSIRAFDDYVHILAGDKPGACAAAGECGRYMVIEADGRAYPCDFFAWDKYCLGGFGTYTVEQLYEHLEESKFIKCPPRNAKCISCLYYYACRGGCRKDYITQGGIVANQYCEAYKKFFIHAYPRLLKIAAEEKSLFGN